MHLSPAELDAAIRLLDGPAEAGHYDHHSGRGEILEAAGKPRQWTQAKRKVGLPTVALN